MFSQTLDARSTLGLMFFIFPKLVTEEEVELFKAESIFVHQRGSARLAFGRGCSQLHCDSLLCLSDCMFCFVRLE